MTPMPEQARQIILAHKGSPTKAQQACMAAGYRLTRGAVRNVLEKAAKAAKEPK